MTAVVNGKDLGYYDNFSAQGLFFSPDSEHIAFGVEKNGEWFIVRDDKKLKKSYHNILPIGFSPDSRHFDYMVLDKNKNNFMVIQGEEKKIYPDTGISIYYSPDNKYYAYLAVEYNLGNPVSRVVVNGDEGRKYALAILDQRGGSVFFTDTRHFNYFALKQEEGKLNLYFIEEEIISEELLKG